MEFRSKKMMCELVHDFRKILCHTRSTHLRNSSSQLNFGHMIIATTEIVAVLSNSNVIHFTYFICSLSPLCYTCKGTILFCDSRINIQ